MGHEVVFDQEPGDTHAQIALIRGAFPIVLVDEEAGLRRAFEMADWIESAPATIFLGRHADALERATMLRRLRASDAARIEFGDDMAALVACFLVPGESLRFGYRDKGEEDRQLPMLQRLARTLSGRLELF